MLVKHTRRLLRKRLPVSLSPFLSLSSLLLCIVFLLGMPDGARAERKLRVGVAGSPPFVVLKKNKVEGIAPEIWIEAARTLGLSYDFIRFASVAEGLKAAARGRVDLLIGSVSITSKRSRMVDFSQPYYRTGQGILTRRSRASFWKTIKPFLRTTFLIGVGTLLFVLFIVGNLIWLAERKVNTNFPQTYLSGVGSGMWFAVVTFTTVGYGDLTPITRRGRVLASLWMITAMITASSLTAGIATSFTLFNLRHAAVESADSLDGVRAAAVKSTTGAAFAGKFGAEVVFFPDLSKALRSFDSGESEAVVFDYSALKYYLKENPNPDFHVIRSRKRIENYGFCAPPRSRLLHRVNGVLLQMLEKGEVRLILKGWGDI